MQAKYKEISFTDKDVVNFDDFIADGEYNPHNVRPWLLHDHGTVIAVVFASSLQDALDEAADNDKLDHLMIDPSDRNDRDFYMVVGIGDQGGIYDPDNPEYIDKAGNKYWWRRDCDPAFLGNASEPFDIESLDAVELPNPPRSFVALFNAKFGEKS